MTSLTSTPPLLPLLANPVTDLPHVVASVIDITPGRNTGDVATNLLDHLLAALGPGNILTGIVSASRGDGTLSLTAPNGTSLTLHHPPEQPLALGSSVTLRLTTLSPIPQAIILAVNGRPLVLRGNNAPATPDAPASNTTAPTPGPTKGPVPTPAPPGQAVTAPPGQAAVSGAWRLASLSFADERAIETAIDQDRLTLNPTSAEAGSVEAPIIATLIRPAPARPGAAPIPLGTRYLVTPRFGGADSATSPAAAPNPRANAVRANPQNLDLPPLDPLAPVTAVPPPSPDDQNEIAKAGADSASPPANAAEPALAAPTPPQTSDVTVRVNPTQIPELPAVSTSATAAGPDFIAQSFQLTGRVIPPRQAGETLVETPLGTLALPVSDSLPAIDAPAIGDAARLRFSAVAPALPRPATPATPALKQAAAAATPLETAIAILTPTHPDLARQVETALSLTPGDQLAAAILRIILPRQKGAAPRDLPETIRKALLAAGRGDLISSLDEAATTIGKTSHPQNSDGWSVTVLPQLGLLSLGPLRLYRKSAKDSESKRSDKAKPGERFVVELALKRLGPVQLDGLVRQQRLDLVMRTGLPLAPELRSLVEQVFADMLTISGWQGGLSFSRAARYPLVSPSPAPSEAPHRGIDV